MMAGDSHAGTGSNPDVYLVKADVNGNSLWTKYFGGAGSDLAYSVAPTQNNAVVIAGETSSTGGWKRRYLPYKVW